METTSSECLQNPAGRNGRSVGAARLACILRIYPHPSIPAPKILSKTRTSPVYKPLIWGLYTEESSISHPL